MRQTEAPAGMLQFRAMDYFILTTRGLEDVALDELRERLPTAHVRRQAYRRIQLTARAADAPALMALRCADDVFVEVATWQGIGKVRSTLDQLSGLAATLDLSPAQHLCAQFRPLAQPVRFAISASFVGRRNYSSPEMKPALAQGVMQRMPWTYVPEEVADGLSLRLFIEHETALLGVRLAAHPLHRRPYKQATVPGSLRPTVAAALLRLADVTATTTLLDPLCGAGTLVIEAALLGATALGGDISGAALAAAHTNLAAGGAHAELRQWDARHLPLDPASVDAVVSNLPFGRQVGTAAELSTLYADLVAEVARVLRPAGCAALLTSQPAPLRSALTDVLTLQIAAQREISLYGQTPTVVIISKS
jgi:tRNA (guanine6-N2)-methyltransferase